MSRQVVKRILGSSFVVGAVVLAWVLGNSPPKIAATGRAKAAESVQSEGTRRMAERLAQLAENPPGVNKFESARILERLRALPLPTDPRERVLYNMEFGHELLNNGQTTEAVERLQDLWELLETQGRADQEGPLRAEVHSLLAVAQLRLGEQENCIVHHGIDSCLLPIRGSGVHTEQRGSRAALREYTEILRRHPDDLRSRWLLNIAYMTLGEYPDKVPAQWLIPPQVFESDHDIKRFYDISSKAGVDVVGRAGGAILDDFDGDGFLDLFVSSQGPSDQIRFFRNAKNGRFEERTREAGLTGLIGGLNIVHADYDNDGDLDVFVLRGAWLHEAGRIPDSLLRNNGDGTFDDVTEEAGMLSYHPSQAGAWGDYDNDGWLDLFIGNESTRSDPHPCELYHNNGDGTFDNVADEAGVAAVAFFKGTAWGDYDNDGRLDLYVSGLSSEPGNLLFRNEGPDAQGRWTFSEVSAAAGVRGPAQSFPTWFFDYNNDGWLDIFVSGYSANTGDIAADYLGLPNDGEKARLYRNRGDGTFADVSHEARVDKVLLTMGCNFGDLDNDGWLDFYAATGNPDFRTLVPNRMFRNVDGRFFQDVTTSGGFGHLQKGHGVAFADWDDDGDQDVFLKVGGALPGDQFQSALFENPGHGNNWITLKLVGSRTNRAAIGARIKVTVETEQGPRDIHVVVTSGSSFGGSSLQQEIGLGRATRIRRIEITWPTSNTRQTFDDVEMNQKLEFREEDPAGVSRLPAR